MKRRHIILALSFTMSLAYGQVVSPALIKNELDKRGISEAELKQKLEEKGVDPSQINPSNLNEVKDVLKHSVEEVAKDKQVKTTAENNSSSEELPGMLQKQQFAKASSENISKAVKEGSSIQEAIAEELIDLRDSLPSTEIFGQHVFRNKNIKLFRQADEIKPSSNYVLGSGDKISVNIWGAAKFSASQEISKEGYVQFDRLPRIYIKGLTLGKTRDLLRSRFAQYIPFNKDQFDVTVNYARTVTVNIVGEVMNSGSYTLPAFNTAFNALVAAGGPTNIGSVRNIQIVRAGQKYQKLDIYEFLLNPDSKADISINDNDYINVQFADRLISIQGSVKRPYIYELTAAENLFDLLRYCGGLQDNASKKGIQIKRIINGIERILDVDIEQLSKAKDVTLFAGDKVMVRSIQNVFENYVEISGAVEFEGNYELTEKMKVSDLLRKANLKADAKRDIAYVFRQNLDKTFRLERVDIAAVLTDGSSSANFSLQAKDKFVIYALEKFVENYTVNVAGAVRNPGKHLFDVSGNMRIADVITLAGGARPDATNYGFVIRSNVNNGKIKQNIKFDLQKALKNDPLENLVISPNDEITLLSRDSFQDKFTLSIQGAVRNPGEYDFVNNLDLASALAKAGGFTIGAASNRIDIFRVVMNNNEPTKTAVATYEVDKDFNIQKADQKGFVLEPFDVIVVRTVPEFHMQRMVSIEGEVRFPGLYAIVEKNEKLSSIISRAGGLTTEAFPEGATLLRSEDNLGYVVMNLRSAIESPNSNFNYVVKSNDLLIIPKTKDLVSIQGAINAYELYPEKYLRQGKINVGYHGSHRAKWYIDEFAAGINENGRKSLITVEYPNGRIKKTKNFLFFKLYPKVEKGSVITVGYKKQKPKADRDNTKKEEVDWGKIVGSAIAQATAVLSLILLIQNINK